MNRVLNRKSLSIQWHITHACDQRCRHCYLFDSKAYQLAQADYLKWPAMEKIIADIAHTARRWRLWPHIFLTGGDPILHPDFFKLLKVLKNKRFAAYVLGNPYHIDPVTARHLKANGIDLYQLSIDGLEQTHDSFRKKGSFQATLQAILQLQKAGIKPVISFTLSQKNCHELLAVMQLARELNVHAFGFDLLVPTGMASALENELLPAGQLRDLLEKVYALEQKLNKKGPRIQWGRKLHLWKLFFHEKGLLKLPAIQNEQYANEILGGCAIGEAMLAIQADGSVFPCPRLPLLIGKLPQTSIASILKQSALIHAFRNRDHYQKCKDCELYTICRGCPAIAYAALGDPFAPFPQCWKEPAKPGQAKVKRQNHFQAWPSVCQEEESAPALNEHGFRDDEKKILSPRSFRWRKIVEQAQRPHLMHVMFQDQHKKQPLETEDTAAKPPVFYLPFQELTASITLPAHAFDLVIDLDQKITDPNRFNQALLALPGRNLIKAAGMIIRAELLSPGLVYILSHYNFELLLRIKPGFSGFDNPLLHELIRLYDGRITVALLDFSPRGSCLIEQLISLGFKSIDLMPQLTGTPGSFKIEDLIALVQKYESMLLAGQAVEINPLTRVLLAMDRADWNRQPAFDLTDLYAFLPASCQPNQVKALHRQFEKTFFKPGGQKNRILKKMAEIKPGLPQRDAELEAFFKTPLVYATG